MSSFEKAGVLFITGLVAVILALALFGTSGTTTPAAETGAAGTAADGGAAGDGGANPDEGSETEPGTDPGDEDIWSGPRDRANGLLGARDGSPEPLPGPNDAGTSPRPPFAASREHVVRAGDRLANIAKQYLGDAGAWKAIADANPGLDPARLKVGQKLAIPERGAVASGTRPDSQAKSPEPEKRLAAADKKPTYVVKKGDTLTSIAQRELRDRAAWRKLFDMNKHVVKNANRLPVGVTLTLPAN